MKTTGAITAAMLIIVTGAARAQAPGLKGTASEQTDGAAAPIYGIKIPPRYRDWTLISVARVGAPLNDMRAKLGNDVAIGAYREGKNPFPDGTIVARLAWNQATSEENNNAVRGILERQLSPDAVQKLLNESFVAGPATNVQFMVKDSRKCASTGGWGFAQFTNGKPDGEALHKTCFPCHAPGERSRLCLHPLLTLIRTDMRGGRRGATVREAEL